MNRRELLAGTAVTGVAFAANPVAAQYDHPLASDITGAVTLENWQKNRAYGLRNFEKITRDVMGANAEHVRELKIEQDYQLYSLPAVKALIEHPAMDSIVILKGNKIVLERYANGITPKSHHMCMSSTKTLVNLLVGKVVAEGKLNLAAKVEQYVPEIGDGYRGRTVADVLAMNVFHEFNEYAAYDAEQGSRLREMLDQEESTIGWEPSKITSLDRRQFIAQFKAGHKDGSNVNRTGKLFYTTANTDLGAWIAERAGGQSTQAAVRDVMHAIGGENTIYIGTDKTGVPIVGGGFIMTPRDWARYGILLWSGGKGVSGEIVGGGPDWTKQTMSEGQVSLGFPDWYYVKGVFANKWGLGHSGWGGQWIWADPISQTVIATLGGFMSKSPTPPEFLNIVTNLSKAVVDHQRNKA